MGFLFHLQYHFLCYYQAIWRYRWSCTCRFVLQSALYFSYFDLMWPLNHFSNFFWITQWSFQNSWLQSTFDTGNIMFRLRYFARLFQKSYEIVFYALFVYSHYFVQYEFMQVSIFYICFWKTSFLSFCSFCVFYLLCVEVNVTFINFITLD